MRSIRAGRGDALVDVCPVVVEATGHAATTGVLPVLADATVAGRDVAAVLPRF